MTKKPGSLSGKRVRKKLSDSFGSALDEVGWKPSSRKLLAPGTIGPQPRKRLRSEQATADIAAERRLGGPEHATTEPDIMEEATRFAEEARRAAVFTLRKFDQHDVVDAAALYIEVCVGDRCLKPLSGVLPEIPHDGDERRHFHAAVHNLIRLYVEGARLTLHRSGDAYELLREPFVALHSGSSPMT